MTSFKVTVCLVQESLSRPPQILLGPCLAVISSIQPEASLAIHGLVLGGLLLFSGFLGLWVHLNYGLKSAAAQFVLSLLWLVIAWEFLSQV